MRDSRKNGDRKCMFLQFENDFGTNDATSGKKLRCA